MRFYLGFDTSCYTTSVAIMAEDGTLTADARELLRVKLGGRGLAQSEMVFQHTRNLPRLFAAAMDKLPTDGTIAGVGASSRPRSLAESYMPAFLVGEGYARVLAGSHRIPLKLLSHQDNHILAGLWSAGGPEAAEFLAVHLSGGTTEMTRVAQTPDALTVTLLGASRDISAGQLIDRMGVALGLPFPAGPHLEALAQAGHSAPVDVPVAVDGIDVSFAGPEAHCRRLLDKGIEPAALAAGVEKCIARSLVKMTKAAVQKTGLGDVLMVGGVNANKFIRGHLIRQLEQEAGVRLHFPASEYSGDNAVGAAFAAFKQARM